jgi:hypothetical protein
MPVTPATRALVRLLPVIAAAALVVPAASAVNRANGDAVARLPDLDQELPARLAIVRARPPARATWRLGFRSAVSNVGDGPLIVEGRRPSRHQGVMSADQVIDREAAPRVVVEAVGQLRYARSPDHEHWHLLGFERYELRRPGSRRAIVEDRKSGFCLGDRYPAAGNELPARPPAAVYTGRCGLERPGLLGVREGISVGYGDDYAAILEGQWLPLDGLRPGRYVLVHRVNADRSLRERSYGNNAASLLLRLRWLDGSPRIDIVAECPGTAHCAAGR